MRKAVWLLSTVALISAVEPLHAQTRVGLYRGVGEYDLSGVDQADVTALRAHMTISRHLVLEAGVTYALVEQSEIDTELYMPEVQAQLLWPIGRLSPYVGIGGGLGIEVPDDARFQNQTQGTMSVALGTLILLPYNFVVAVDGRLRNYGRPFTASGAEATFGIGYRF